MCISNKFPSDADSAAWFRDHTLIITTLRYLLSDEKIRNVLLDIFTCIFCYKNDFR